MNANLTPMQQRGWQPVIGLETHVQLTTQSKIFSPAPTQFGASPNTQVHWIDAALPGTLPVANLQAIHSAIRFGLAIHAEIRQHSLFARKHYFYPDLPKAYQISQFEAPIVEHGHLHVNVNGLQKKIEILRAHLEEDAGKLVHDLYPLESAVDLNRAGTPLIEVVTTPCMASAEEAVAYAKALHHLVQWLGICDGNMQEGSFRVDANVSLRPINDETLGTRCEIKNLNSFRFLERAMLYEMERQADILEAGGSIRQETRLYDPDRDETRSMRSKEDAHDYRYFPDPDLLPIEIHAETLNDIRQNMPALPAALIASFTQHYGLSLDDAETLTAQRDKAEFFMTLLQGVEQSLAAHANAPTAEKIAKTCANWTLGAVSAWVNEMNGRFADLPQQAFAPTVLIALLARLLTGEINNHAAKTLFAYLQQHPKDALTADAAQVDAWIDAHGLRQKAQSEDDLLPLVQAAIDGNAKAVAEYRGGKEKALMSLVGAVMKASAGKAPADQVKALLEKLLTA